MSAHRDTFARDHLPPRDQWPVMDYASRPELAYPRTLNCAAELVDAHVAAGRGGRIAIVAPAEQWTYARLMEQTNRLANVLVRDLGLVPGNRVLLRGPNNPMMAAAWLAVLKAGGIGVTTMPLLRPRELSAIIDKAQVSLALGDARFIDDLAKAQAASPMLKRIVAFDGAHGELDALMQRASPEFTSAPTDAEETAIIAFTSGTTGQAKGTMHSHRDILAVCDLFPRSCLRANEDDLFCGSPPLAFTFGLGGILLFPLRIGASTLLLEQATPPHLIKGIQDHRVTVCLTAPTAFRAMLPLVPQHDIASLRKCVSAGEHLPVATFEAWRKATGIPIIDGIGSTELLHIFVSAPEQEIRPGSTGRAVPGYEVKVVDDAGVEVADGTVGRLAVRGPTGCRYLDDAERQRAYVKDGWNYPGDSFSRDADGYFWYQARTDDMIISSGYNIAATEVENVLLEHPAVQECGVVGVPDEARGHVIKAFIVLRPGHTAGEDKVKALQEHVKAQIAPYKYPRAIEFVTALPRTETGKLQRFRLRETT